MKLLLIIALLGIFWFQFKTLAKQLKLTNTSKINIDTNRKTINFNDKCLAFSNIKSIEVRELDNQMDFLEQAFTRTAHYHFFAEIIFYLNNGLTEKYQTNSKGQLYKILKILQPYIKINADIESYKQQIIDAPTIFGILVGTIIIILAFCNSLIGH